MEREIKINSRYREKYNSHPKLDFFKTFKKKYKEYEKYDTDKLKEILVCVQKNFSDLLLTNKDGIELPYGLGNIRIFSYRPSKKSRVVDVNTSRKLRHTVFFSNMKTDGLMFKIVYTNRYVKLPFLRHTVWSFDAADKLRDKASKYFVENYELYTNINKKKISTFFINNNGNN